MERHNPIALERYAAHTMTLTALYLFLHPRAYEVVELLPDNNKYAMKVTASGIEIVTYLTIALLSEYAITLQGNIK